MPDQHKPSTLPRAALFAAALLLCACRSPAGPVQDGPGHTLSDARPMRIGFASVDVTPDKHYPLGGFGGGARREAFPVLFGVGVFGRLSLHASQALHEDGQDDDDRSHYLRGAEGSHDPIQARAMVIKVKGQDPIALCRLDLVVMCKQLRDRVLELTRDIPLSPERFVLTANHTHSGPGAYHPDLFPKLIAIDNFRPELFEMLAQGVAGAIRQALKQAQPATLALARAIDPPVEKGGIAKNRRAKGYDSVKVNDKDPEMLMLVARASKATKDPKAPPEPGPILGVLLNYAIHPTVLGPDNLYFSADVAGALEREISATLPGQPPVLFFNGAEGDIGPSKAELRHRGGLMACKGIARRAAKLVREPILKARGHPTVATASALASRDFGSPYVFLTPCDRDAFYRGEKSAASWLTFPLTLPLNLPIWLLGAVEARVVLTWNMRFGLVTDLGFYTDTTTFPMGILRLKVGDQDLLFAQVPGEATYDVGLAIKAAGDRRGATKTFVLGLANDAISYIASKRRYNLGGYEALTTLFGPDTSKNLLEGLERCMDRVYVNPR